MIKFDIMKNHGSHHCDWTSFKRHDVVDAVPLFQHTPCVKSLFAYKFDRLNNFSTSDREMNVNISNEFNFSNVHGAMNHSGSLAKLT